MTARMYYDNDADPAALRGQTVAVIGYGSQGHAHALNAHESRVNVLVALAPASNSRPLADDAGLRVADVADAVRDADVVMILVPDTAQKAVYDAEIEPNLRPGQLLMFAHGFNIHFGRIDPPADIDVGMVAPKGPGHLLRSVYVQGGGVPALFAVHGDATGTARQRVLAYARALGNTRAGVLETTFAEETETDLFGEQTLLCGGVSALVKAAFETLVEAGYQPELAYFETMHELKLIVDLMYRGGLNFMRFSVSDTAEYGDYVSGPRIIDDHVRATMQAVLREIQDGSFASRWIAESDSGRAEFERLKVDVIEAGFPAASPGDFEAVRRIAQETRGGIAVAALARCRDGDPQRAIEAIKVAERPHLHVFIATSDIHLKHKLRIDRETALAEAVRWVRHGRTELGRDAEIEFSAEDASRTDPDYLLRVYEAVVDAGASTVNIPDTVGYAIPSEF